MQNDAAKEEAEPQAAAEDTSLPNDAAKASTEASPQEATGGAANEGEDEAGVTAAGEVHEALEASEGQQFGAAVGAGGASILASADASREARIIQRRTRIQARKACMTRTDDDNEVSAVSRPTNEPEQKSTGKSKSQMVLSKKRIDSTKLQGTLEVTTIRVDVAAREAQRRLEEERKIEIWEQKRQEEAAKSVEMQQKIEKEWEKSLKITVLTDLHGLLLSQKKECDILITTKNKLINEYITDLKSKDDAYVKELKRQAEEIDSTLARMESQYKTFQKTLNQEFDQIERAFVEERTDLLHRHNNEIESLLVKRRENERKFMEERGERMEDHIYQLEQLRIHDAEEYNLVKIKLETDVKVLEQQLQQMRGTYQLNTEKLEYNFQVLKKREEENGTILSSQKRKIARSTDHLNTLKAKINKQEKTFQQEYISLTDDYKRITDQFKELQKKFRHFQIADRKKYRQIWMMNEEIAKEKLRKVIQADRIIHEQQLGLEWTPPEEDMFRSAEHNMEKVERREKEPVAAALMIASTFIDADNEDENEVKESFGLKMTRRGYSKTMKRMLELLCNEAGFLVEERLQKLLSPLHKDEQSLMKLDSILKALGVESVEDIESLTSYFVHKPKSDEVGVGPAADGSAALIHPNEVVKAIRRFVEEHRNKAAPGEAESDHISRPESQGQDGETQSEEDVGESPPKSAENETDSPKKYWEKFDTCMDDRNYRTWSAVYVGMEKYNQILTERWQLSQEITSVTRQNAELRQLLKQYMTAKLNDDLQVPPTRILLAQAGLMQ